MTFQLNQPVTIQLRNSWSKHSPPLEGWQAQPDGVVALETTPPLRGTPPQEGNISQNIPLRRI